VVFVTRHSDFESRKKSALSGGQDLIAKPYLSFEITVKALTLVIRNRLQNGIPVAGGVEFAVETTADAPPAEAATSVSDGSDLVAPPEPVTAEAGNSSPGMSSPPAPYYESTETVTSHGEPDDSDALASRGTDARDLPDEFASWAPAYVESLCDQARAAMVCTVPNQLHDLLAGLYIAVQSLSAESELAGFPTVHKLSTTLGGMLKKLMDKPESANASAWSSALAALELLGELPRAGSIPDSFDSTARILVVDDDLVARRAISGSVQLVFGKPDTADSGETAIAMAAGKAFDLVFLDICMPGIDGFGTCVKIHETELNRNTPVIFITNQDDSRSRQKAAACGGSGFLLKTVSRSQITLTALTLILRHRLDHMETESIIMVNRELADCAV
jgi:CheY-like chemotaxis protein